MDAIKNNTSMGAIINSIIGVGKNQPLDISAFRLLQEYIQTETANESAALDKAIRTEVQKAGYDLNSKEGRKEIDRVTEAVKGY
jgi:hypothetical protein